MGHDLAQSTKSISNDTNDADGGDYLSFCFLSFEESRISFHDQRASKSTYPLRRRIKVPQGEGWDIFGGGKLNRKHDSK